MTSKLHMSPSISTAPSTAATPVQEKPNPFSRPSSPTMERHDRLGFVGLGSMGTQMALNLAVRLHEQQQPPLLVWNRSQDRIDAFVKLAAEGKDGKAAPVHVAKSPEEIGQTCDFILTSLGSDTAVNEVYARLFAGQEKQTDAGEGIKPGGKGRSTTFIDTSTISPSLAGKLENFASQKRSRHFLSCPAFGEPPVAADAQLIFAISGDYHARKHAAHILIPTIGKRVFDLGSNVERAASFKLVGNLTILGLIELLSEAMTLADRSGVGADNMYKLLQEIYPSPTILSYAKKILQNNFKGEDGFTLSGGISDALHIRDMASDHNVPVPVIDAAHQHLIAARANGGGSLDWSSLVGGVRIAAGLPPFKAPKARLERYE